ncbi:TPA: toll/interleukin-1 receptor domain-containing protein [Pseudomonas aeruginosa]|nr:toll/interleukin-1 receptor domain-containing protein [Pseudomonas aeruginosa]HBO3041047.1 toll/interleukin-1 receptor domain-containing protein [Pseudomonas aeruginosa]
MIVWAALGSMEKPFPPNIGQKSMLHRAFLSHSSTDKEFVRAVANELGRQYCLFDEQVFEDGEQFKNAIETMLDESAVFVLFVSEATLERIWVQFEITEAWYRMLEARISKALVFLLSPSIQFGELPKWLSRAKISNVVAAKATAREIRHHLDELLRSHQQAHFEGRSADIAHLQKILTPLGNPPPRIVGVYGLPNVGRRTFVKKAAQLSLSYPKTLEVKVSEGDSLTDISVKLANLLEPFSTKEGFESIVESIRRQNEDELIARDIANLNAATSHKELPILLDDGGLLTPDGSLTEPVQKLVSKIEGQDGLYLFFVSSRKPPSEIPSMHLRPLAEEDSQRLIAKIADVEKVELSAGQVREIAEYVNGYPPCAYYAIDQAKAYGVHSVIMDKNRLVQFRTSAFVKFLKEKQLTEVQRSILLILARYSPVPAQVLSKSLALDETSLIHNLVALIDHSLVVPDANGLYAIAGPVLEAVLSEFRDDSEINHELVFSAFKELLAEDEAELPRLELYRQLFKAALRTGAPSKDVFHLTSDLISFAKDFYHRREYKQCIDSARLAVGESPLSISGRDYLIRALVQEGIWTEAEVEIENFRSYAPIRDYHFLNGFYHRKAGRLRPALDELHLAEKHGRRGISLYREIASCYFLLGDLANAKRYVENGLRIRENRFLVDLNIQIAIAEKQEKAARESLVQLEMIDSEAFVWHRRSTVELRFGSSNSALQAAEKAVETVDGRAPFGMLAQLVTCQIREGKHIDADNTLQKLNRLYSNQKSDIRLGLECRLEIARHRYSKALSVFARIQDASTYVYMSMQRDALEGILSSVLTDEQRKEYREELAKLNNQLKDFDDTWAWLSLMQ